MALVAQDTFTDSNNTPITLHTMNVGNGWTMLRGNAADMTIQSNSLAPSASVGGQVTGCITDVENSDGEYQIDVTFPDSDKFATQFILRAVDEDNFIFAQAIRDGITNTLKIAYNIGGTSGDLTTASTASLRNAS